MWRWSQFSRRLRGRCCRGVPTRPLTRGRISVLGASGRKNSAFFDVRVCHPKADSYKNLLPKQIYRQHKKEKKHFCSSRILEIEQGTFTPLVFTCNYWRYVRRMSALSLPSRRTNSSEKARELCIHYCLD